MPDEQYVCNKLCPAAQLPKVVAEAAEPVYGRGIEKTTNFGEFYLFEFITLLLQRLYCSGKGPIEMVGRLFGIVKGDNTP